MTPGAPAGRPVIVLGGSGFVGSRVVSLWPMASRALVAPTRAELDVLDRAALERFLDQTAADAVLNLAAWADVDAAEAQRGDRDGLVYQLNAALPGTLGELCRASGTHLIHISTDYVFDGTRDDRAYREDDPLHPLCWYAQTKAEGEQRLRQANAQACVARIEMPFSGLDYRKQDVARIFHTRLMRGQGVVGVTDQKITPLFLDDAVAAFTRLVYARQQGVIHVASTTSTTPYEYARGIAQRLGLDPSLIEPATLAEFAGARPARRPQHSWLDVTRFEGLFGPGILRSVDDELDRWVNQRLATTVAI